MARVQQAAIDKAMNAIGEIMSSPAFPSGDELLKSNRILCSVVTMIRANNRTIPEKTICGLLVEALDLRKDVTGEALWKRYRRATINKDGSGVNRDTSEQLFIPPGISQITLAAGITEFFESQGYSSVVLLNTCLMAIDKMTVSLEVSEIKDAVDARYRPQDDGNIEETGP